MNPFALIDGLAFVGILGWAIWRTQSLWWLMRQWSQALKAGLPFRPSIRETRNLLWTGLLWVLALRFGMSIWGN